MSSLSGVGRFIALRAPPAARKCTFPISTVLVAPPPTPRPPPHHILVLLQQCMVTHQEKLIRVFIMTRRILFRPDFTFAFNSVL